MLPRALEVLLVALLVMLTLGVAFQFQNHALLRDILEELRRRPDAVAASQSPPQVAADPVTPASRPAPVEAPAAVRDVPPAVKNRPQPQPEPPVTIAAMDRPPVVSPDPSPSQPTEEPKEPSPPRIAPQPPVAQPVVAAPPMPDPAPAVAPAQDEAWQRVGQTMSQIIEELLGGEYDKVLARCSSDLLATGMMNRGALAAAVEPVRQEHGQLKRITHHKAPTGRVAPNLIAYEIGVEMADGHPLLFTINLDQKQRISGLFMR